MELEERSLLAQALLEDRQLPEQVTEELFARHPESVMRALGDGIGRSPRQIVRTQVAYLAGAVQAGNPKIFGEYAAYCGSLLAARDIDCAYLQELFELLEAKLCRTDRPGRDLLERMFACARGALKRKPATFQERPDSWAPLRLDYLSAALAGHRDEAWRATRDARAAGLTTLDIYKEVLLWAQRRLGELWLANQITVAQEHLASVVTQSILARMYPEILGPRSAGRAVLVGVAGEQHVLPAQFAADLLELQGWNVMLVGTNVPLNSLLQVIETEQPDVLGISTTMLFNLPNSVALVRAVRQRFSLLPIVAGGLAVRGANALAIELGLEIDGIGDTSAFSAFTQHA